MKLRFILLALPIIISVSTASADVSLGGGFTCSGSSILMGSKTVTFTKAKSTLAITLAKLKKKLAAAPLKKKKGIKAQIKAAKQTQTLIKSCSDGKLSDVVALLASGSGKYAGTYSGTVGGFIPISGSVQVLFELNGTVLTATLSLGGNLGSTLNAQPLVFQQDIGGLGYPLQVVITSTFIGDVTLTIGSDGHINIVNSNFGSTNAGLITFDGQFSNQNQNIVSTLNGSYSGVGFTGGATLAKQP